MKIAILGTRGIPNHYGGFEQFAEYFSVFLAEKGHEIYVYNSSSHPYQENTYKGVNIIHQKDPEDKVGTFGAFFYDYNCIKDSRKRDFDIILQLGYTSNSIWYFMLPKNSVIITNMDGLEWKRSKYNRAVKRFLKFAERLAAKKSDYLVADSIGIQKHLKDSFKKDSTYIAYGSDTFDNPKEDVLEKYQVSKENYSMLIARFEPENNLEMILDGVVLSNNNQDFLVVGNYNTKFGEYLRNKFKVNQNIKFLGAIYNLEELNNLRCFSFLYFHGHSVGGTNPSLLEAMGSKALIAANNNEFNKGVLKENALYFSDANDVKELLLNIRKSDYLRFIENNYQAIQSEFNWKRINEQYLKLFEKCLNQKQRK